MKDINWLVPISCRVLVLKTEDDAKRMVKLHATQSKEIMFTTYSFTHNSQYSYDAIYQARHVWECLRQIDRLKNAIILTYDDHSCQVLWEHGIPCLLDRYMPQPDALPGTIATRSDLVFQGAQLDTNHLEYAMSWPCHVHSHYARGEKSSVIWSKHLEQ